MDKYKYLPSSENMKDNENPYQILDMVKSDNPEVGEIIERNKNEDLKYSKEKQLELVNKLYQLKLIDSLIQKGNENENEKGNININITNNYNVDNSVSNSHNRRTSSTRNENLGDRNDQEFEDFQRVSLFILSIVAVLMSIAAFQEMWNDTFSSNPNVEERR